MDANEQSVLYVKIIVITIINTIGTTTLIIIIIMWHMNFVGNSTYT